MNNKLITCPACGASVSDKAKNCPHCGHPINRFRLLKSKLFWLCLIGILCVVGIIIGIQDHNRKERARQEMENYIRTESERMTNPWNYSLETEEEIQRATLTLRSREKELTKEEFDEALSAIRHAEMRLMAKKRMEKEGY